MNKNIYELHGCIVTWKLKRWGTSWVILFFSFLTKPWVVLWLIFVMPQFFCIVK